MDPAQIAVEFRYFLAGGGPLWRRLCSPAARYLSPRGQPIPPAGHKWGRCSVARWRREGPSAGEDDHFRYPHLDGRHDCPACPAVLQKVRAIRIVDSGASQQTHRSIGQQRSEPIDMFNLHRIHQGSVGEHVRIDPGGSMLREVEPDLGSDRLHLKGCRVTGQRMGSGAGGIQTDGPEVRHLEMSDEYAAGNRFCQRRPADVASANEEDPGRRQRLWDR